LLLLALHQADSCRKRKLTQGQLIEPSQSLTLC